MSNVGLDRTVIKLLLKDESVTQEQIAETLTVDLSRVRGSILRLTKSGLVELNRRGQRQIPRLAFFSKFDQVEEAVRDLLGHTLTEAL